MSGVNVVALSEIVCGALLLIFSASRRSDSAARGSVQDAKLQQRRATRQIVFSICGLALVIIGVATQRFAPMLRAVGPCAEVASPAAATAAPQTRCYHGAPREPRG